MTHPTGGIAAPPTRKPTDDELDVYGLTHRGKVRTTNQDHFLICSLRKQMLVHLTSLSGLDQMPVLAERLAFLAVGRRRRRRQRRRRDRESGGGRGRHPLHRGERAVLLCLARRER